MMYTFGHQGFGWLTVSELEEEEGFVVICFVLDKEFPRLFYSDIGALEAFRIHLGLQSVEQVSSIVWQGNGMTVSFKVHTEPMRNEKNYARNWSYRLLGFTQQTSKMRANEFFSAWGSWVKSLIMETVDDYEV